MFRDKDYLITDTGVIFKVKSYSHPRDRVYAFPRFIPFEAIPMRLWGHTWNIRGREYSRFDLRVTTTTEIQDAFHRFYALYPQFVGDGDFGVACVPHSSIVEHLTPQQSLSRIRSIRCHDPLQAAACKFADLCIGLGLPVDCLGVTDSLMFDAHTLGFSDVDFVISGAGNYSRVIDYLRSPSRDSSITFPSLEQWEERYTNTQVKDMPLSPHVYALHKLRKYEELFLDAQKLSLFAVRDRNTEDLGALARVGPLEISGTVSDASEGMFRPSIYKIKIDSLCPRPRRQVTVITVVNHRREYISQVMNGEEALAFGLAWQASNSSVILELGSLELRGRDFLVARALNDSCS